MDYVHALAGGGMKASSTGKNEGPSSPPPTPTTTAAASAMVSSSKKADNRNASNTPSSSLAAREREQSRMQELLERKRQREAKDRELMEFRHAQMLKRWQEGKQDVKPSKVLFLSDYFTSSSSASAAEGNQPIAQPPQSPQPQRDVSSSHQSKRATNSAAPSASWAQKVCQQQPSTTGPGISMPTAIDKERRTTERNAAAPPQGGQTEEQQPSLALGGVKLHTFHTRSSLLPLPGDEIQSLQGPKRSSAGAAAKKKTSVGKNDNSNSSHPFVDNSDQKNGGGGGGAGGEASTTHKGKEKGRGTARVIAAVPLSGAIPPPALLLQTTAGSGGASHLPSDVDHIGKNPKLPFPTNAPRVVTDPRETEPKKAKDKRSLKKLILRERERMFHWIETYVAELSRLDEKDESPMPHGGGDGQPPLGSTSIETLGREEPHDGNLDVVPVQNVEEEEEEEGNDEEEEESTSEKEESQLPVVSSSVGSEQQQQQQDQQVIKENLSAQHPVGHYCGGSMPSWDVAAQFLKKSRLQMLKLSQVIDQLRSAKKQQEDHSSEDQIMHRKRILTLTRQLQSMKQALGRVALPLDCSPAAAAAATTHAPPCFSGENDNTVSADQKAGATAPSADDAAAVDEETQRCMSALKGNKNLYPTLLQMAVGVHPLSSLIDRRTPHRTTTRDHSTAVPMVREYCVHVLTNRIDELAWSALAKLQTAQKKLKQQQPLHFRARMRYLSGLKEVMRSVAMGRARLVLLAPDVECVDGATSEATTSSKELTTVSSVTSLKTPVHRLGMNSAIRAIADGCAEHRIPWVCCLSRARLGQAIKCGSSSVSAIAVLSAEGANAECRALVDEVKLQLEEYALLTATNSSGGAGEVQQDE